ncbi:MAG: FAD-dependent oxidoreductase [Gallionellaceae bacterium]
MDSEFLIVGAGVIGLSTAAELLQRGAGVTLVDSGALGRESSWAGGGILSPLCPWNYSIELTRLTNRSAAQFPVWANALHVLTGIDPEFERSGMLVLPPFDQLIARKWCDEHKVKMEERYNGLLLPDIAQVRNPRLVQALRKQVEILGGRIVEFCEVQAIEAYEGQVRHLVTSHGNFSAERYIITAGAWSKQLLGKHALHIDIKPIRGQMLLFKFAEPPLPHIVLQDGMYLIPRRDGHLLVGSTLEDVGFDKSTTVEARNSLWQRAQLLLPALREMSLLQHWSGLRPGSPHNIPVIGRHPQLENLYINSGHFRYGVTMAPISAEILLNELNGTSQPFDVTPYAIKY